MSRFRSSVGRIAFARGNSSWAREFNSNLNAVRRGFVSCTNPLSLNRNRLSMSAMMALAGEVPTLTGFAEQFRGMSSLAHGSLATENSELVSDDEVLVSAAEVTAIDSVVASLAGNGVSTKTWSLDGLRTDEQRYDRRNVSINVVYNM